MSENVTVYVVMYEDPSPPFAVYQSDGTGSHEFGIRRPVTVPQEQYEQWLLAVLEWRRAQAEMRKAYMDHAAEHGGTYRRKGALYNPTIPEADVSDQFL